MTWFERSRYDSLRSRGDVISNARTAGTAVSGQPYDIERLERAVSTLVAEHERLQKDAEEMRRELLAREQRIRSLETQLLEANQRRQDTGKRIDELIAELDQLDAQLESVEPAR